MNEIIIIDLPKPHGEVGGCWYNVYPVHKGTTKTSLNYATLYADQKKIIPDQAVIKKDYKNFINLIKKTGSKLHILPFPKELNQQNCLHHDAVFFRDAGLMYKDYWIKANFSVSDRKIIKLPADAYIEFGEVFFIHTKNETFYLGGLSRSNKKGHDFVRKILNPDHYCLIKSSGYHLDTVLSPVINKSGELIAFILNKENISENGFKKIKKLNKKIILIKKQDSFGDNNRLGDYTVNALTAPGIFLNCGKFSTLNVEEKLKKMEIKHQYSPLTYFRFAGGSFHCLTNEIYK